MLTSGAGAIWTRRVWFLAALLMAASAGCAYYNTFYFAKRYYAQAEKLVRESDSDMLPPEAVRRYDQAIEQCSKVLTFHGGSRWVDDAIYLMGASYYGKREYEQALRRFRELITNYPDTRLATRAHYMSGLCHYERQDFEQMEAAFNRALDRDPDFRHRDDILFTLARAAEIRRDKNEAVRRFRDLIGQYPGSERAEEGLMRIGDLYFDDGRADSAHMAYQELTRTARRDEVYREAQMKMSDALVRLDRSEEAVRILHRLIPDDMEPGRTREEWPAQARIRLARVYNSMGEHEQALESLREVVENFSFSALAAEAQFQVGYTYEVYMDSLAAARSAYEQTSRLSGRSVFREQAISRARNLQQLESLSVQAVGDSATSEDIQADAMLRIAELYLFSQDKAGDALITYREIIDEFPSSRTAPRAAYGAAWIRLNRMEGERDEALEEFRSLIARYPESSQARGALDLLILEEADTTGLRGLLVEPEPEPDPEPEPEPVPVTAPGPDEEALPEVRVSPVTDGGAPADSAAIGPADADSARSAAGGRRQP